MTREQILKGIDKNLASFNWALNKETGDIVCCDKIACGQCALFDAHKNFISCRAARSLYLCEMEDNVREA